MVIVGSSAAKHWWDDWREPSDMDVWSCKGVDPAQWGVRVDSHFLPEGIINLVPTEDSYATPDALYTIKLSHLGWDNHAWDKHKQDVLAMQHKGCKIIPKLFEALYEYWKGELGNKDFLSLSQNKEDFFTDNVDYQFPHDDLHELVAYPNKPMYTNVLKDGHDVLTDKGKFDKLSFEDQVKLFREEMSVIMFERWLLPSQGSMSILKAWQWTVRKTITTLTKGWATKFIVLNIEQFVRPDWSYFNNILEEFNMSNKVDLTVFEEIAEKSGESLEQVVYGLASDELWDIEDHVPDNYEWVDGETGGEGSGEYCYGVFKLGDTIYKANWSYYSYHGCDFDYIVETLKEVQPKEKTITVYE